MLHHALNEIAFFAKDNFKILNLIKMLEEIYRNVVKQSYKKIKAV